MFVKRLSLNQLGRDFVVGDIHGCFGLVEAGLERVRFDTAKDRLISVGDLINHGPESDRCLSFLQQSWFHAVRGNHEHEFPDAYPYINLEQYKTFVANWGMDWVKDTDQNTLEALKKAFRALPYAIEIETEHGLVGVVHAEIPQALSWQQFLSNVELGKRGTLKSAVYDRNRVKNPPDNEFIEGLWRVFHGHSTFEKPETRGNRVYTDSGANHAYRAKKISGAGLSIVNALASDEDIIRANFIDGVLTVDCKP